MSLVMEPAMLTRLTSTVMDYDWGSATALSEHLGTAATGGPQAELWLGAHPAAPSMLPDGERLDAHLARHSGLLGDASARFGGRLPFLMKLLAAARPLSLQVHPDAASASAGFAREEAAGIPVDAPTRSFRDPSHKPEIIVALTGFHALCGFRDPARSAAELGDLLGSESHAGFAAEIADALRDPDEGRALRSAFGLILSGRPEVRSLARAAGERALSASTPLADTIRRAYENFGDDPGVLGAALLNRIDLVPGEALFLGAGVVHAYLEGLGIEAMAASDNVLRGGLTGKHVDVPRLMAAVDFCVQRPVHISPETTTEAGVRISAYRTPAQEFSVHVVLADSGPRTLDPLAGPGLLIVSDGAIELASGDESLVVGRGESAFIAAGRPLAITGLRPGSTAYLTTVG